MRGVVMLPVDMNVPGDCAADLEAEHTRERTSALVILKLLIVIGPISAGKAPGK